MNGSAMHGWIGGLGMGSMDWSGGPWVILLALLAIAGIVAVTRGRATLSGTAGQSKIPAKASEHGRSAGERRLKVRLTVDHRETRLTRRRHDRIAPIYDAREWLLEWCTRRWRSDLWSRVGAGRILELGVGTGKNSPYDPEEMDPVCEMEAPAGLPGQVAGPLLSGVLFGASVAIPFRLATRLLVGVAAICACGVTAPAVRAMECTL